MRGTGCTERGEAMSTAPGSVPITLDAFERCEIPLDQFNHRAHVTVACLYLRAFPPDGAIDRMRRGIHAFNAAHKVESTPTSGYHETLTVAWMRVLDAVMRTHGAGQSVDEFLEQHPFLLCRTLLRLYYSRDRIMSAQARREWVEPDLAPLPRSPGAKADGVEHRGGGDPR